jgi:hypothetical protein
MVPGIEPTYGLYVLSLIKQIEDAEAKKLKTRLTPFHKVGSIVYGSAGVPGIFLKGEASCYATDPAIFFANKKSIISPQTAVRGGLRFTSGGQKNFETFV